MGNLLPSSVAKRVYEAGVFKGLAADRAHAFDEVEEEVKEGEEL